jgi:2-isopropylmalate synthase
MTKQRTPLPLRHDLARRPADAGRRLLVEDKIAIAAMLDEFGIDYVEGGYPGANPTRHRLLRGKAHIARQIRRLRHDQARRALGLQRSRPRALLQSSSDAICFVAKSWDYHVKVALGCTNEENLDAIRDRSRPP